MANLNPFGPRARRLETILNTFLGMTVLLVPLLLGISCGDSGKDRPTLPLFNTETATPTPSPTATAAPVRPSGAVFIQNNFCACLKKKPDILNNCDSFCSSKNDQNSTLYVNTKVGPEIELNASLGNLFKWCTQEIPGAPTNPGCVLRVSDGLNSQDIPITTRAGSNSFTVNIQALDYDKSLLAQIVETSSGATSDSFQLRKHVYTDVVEPQGPVKVTPINIYSCIDRSGSQDGQGNNFYENAIRVHYFFQHAVSPPSLTPGDKFRFCHDIVKYGSIDSPLYPRLELIEQFFFAWDESDARFFDQDANSKLDINDQIKSKLSTDFGITVTDINVFTEFRWPSSPETTTTAPRLGYIMSPWIEAGSSRGYCPTQVHYNSGIPVFRVLRDFVGDTEGVYLGIKEPETFTNTAGVVQTAPTDIMIIRESLLKKIWFYVQNGLAIAADETSAGNKTIMFYWPADPVNPLVRKSQQRVYTIRSVDDLNSQGSDTGIRTTVRPSDKRFGCVPLHP